MPDSKDEPKPGETIAITKEVLLEKHDPPNKIVVAKEVLLDKTAPVNVPPKTTSEQDRTTASQRRVNLIWETTQAVIAVTVTVCTLIVAGILCIRGSEATAAFLLLSNAFFLIIGFYFSRTNHTKVGGIGDKSEKER